MKKSILFTLMALLPLMASARVQVNGLYYDLFSNDVASVARWYLNGDVKYSGDVTIAESVESDGKIYPVLSISASAFTSCSGLTSVSIPNSVEAIGNNAFYNCTNLTTINIPNSITLIGKTAFYGCSSLTSIIIPSSVTTIRDDAFKGCYFEKQNFINNSSLDAEANNYWGAKIVDSKENGFLIKDGILLEYAGNEASVTIPNSVTEIGECAFDGCKDLTSVIIPSSVTKIGYWSFRNCSSLTEITIPNSVTSIGFDAFLNCSNLTEITISNSMTEIGSGAFDGTAWYKNQPDGVVYVGKIVYKYKGTMPENTTISIKEGTIAINSYAFSSCSNLIGVTIPKSMTQIRYGAFYSCSGLTSLIVENGNTKFDSRDNCNAIIETATNTLIEGCKNTVIPNSVTCIGSSAFNYCSGLTSVTIPNSVTNIENGAFYGCSNLTSIIVESGNKTYDSRDNCNAIIETASNTLLFGCNNTVIPNSVTSIGEDSFRGFSGLTELTIPNSVTLIGNGAFYDCNNLTKVTIPNSVTSIEEWAFGYCSNLTKVTIGNSVESVGEKAFYYCSSLESVTCKAISVPTTGSDAFSRVPQSSATLYVPASALEDYKTTTPWSGFGTIEAIPDGGLRGDANGDGEIGMPDVMFIVNYILGTPDASFNTEAADANKDGEVGMPDVMFIVNYILNGKFPEE